MTEAPTSPAADTWEGILETLRKRYPGQKDSVLFCLYKLQFRPEATLRDFAPEAKLYGIPLAGRALHSARLLLGLIKESKEASPVAAAVELTDDAPRARRRPRPTEPDDGGASIEQQVMSAMQQIQSAAGQQADQLRDAIRQAIAILQRALGS